MNLLSNFFWKLNVFLIFKDCLNNGYILIFIDYLNRNLKFDWYYLILREKMFFWILNVKIYNDLILFLIFKVKG